MSVERAAKIIAGFHGGRPLAPGEQAFYSQYKRPIGSGLDAQIGRGIAERLGKKQREYANVLITLDYWVSRIKDLIPTAKFSKRP